MENLIALDTETTGMDFWHASRPFFVTISDAKGNVTFWEWDVDPLTREVDVRADDVEEIKEQIDRADRIVTHNGKFDVRALQTIGIEEWPWEKTEDTLIAGHLLASNQKHDLTSMLLHYLGEDIKELEDGLEKSVKECRRKVQQAQLKVKRMEKKGQRHLPFPDGHDLDEWLIAEETPPWGPSLKGKGIWRADGWLPRTLFARAKENCVVPDPKWEKALRDYANADSPATAFLWQELEGIIRGRKLWAIYRKRMESIPVACKIEERGPTWNRDSLLSLRKEYAADSERLHSRCVSIAKSYKYDLKMPKGASNGSLRDFCFEVMKLPPVFNKKAKSSAACLDSKNAIPFYLNTLPNKLRPWHFISSLARKRAVDTALSYLASYERFALPLEEWEEMGTINEKGEQLWFRLHPTLNPTGTDTLRWSSSNPNSQNIKKEKDDTGRSLRSIFGPAPGREWYSLDAKNIELRIPAYESGQQEFIDLFERPDDPPYYGSNHILVFHILWPELWDKAVKEVGWDKVGPHCKKVYAGSYYQWVKNGNFAVQYGAVDRTDGMGTADMSYHQKGAQAKIKARFTKQEGLNQKWIKFAERNGYVETLPDKSVDPTKGYPILCSRTEGGKVLPTVPLNYHVQGTAMWWTMQAMIRCQEKLDEWREQDGFDAYIILQVHDELVFDFPKSKHPVLDELERLKRNPKGFKRPDCNLWRVRVLQRLMELGGTNIGIPTPVGAEYHVDNWLEGVTL